MTMCCSWDRKKIKEDEIGYIEGRAMDKNGKASERMDEKERGEKYSEGLRKNSLLRNQ